MTENKGRKAFSWSASLAIHAVGVVLVLVAGFHLATPSGSVSDQTEFEAVGPTGAPPPPAVAPIQNSAQAPQTQEVQPQEKYEDPEAEAPSDHPAVDEAPKPEEPVAHDNTDLPEKGAEADVANVDPAQEPGQEVAENSAQAAPTAAPATGPEQIAGGAPQASPVESPQPAAPTAAATPEGTPPIIGTSKDGTPLIDEKKLTEAFGNHKPSYPWTARLRRQQGTVVLKAFINKNGQIEQVTVEQSSGSQLLDEEAQSAYSHWKYVSGVSGWFLKPFKFSLK